MLTALLVLAAIAALGIAWWLGWAKGFNAGVDFITERKLPISGRHW